MPEPLIEKPTRLLAVAAGTGLLGGVAVWLALVSADGSVRPWLVIALTVTGCLLVAMWALLAHRRWKADNQGAAVALERMRPAPPTDRERGGLESVERRLARAMQDAGRFNDVLRPQLSDLAAHRLRTRLGVDCRTDPNRAHNILGDSLWQLMTTPSDSVPTRQQLETWIRAIEAI